MPKRLFAVAALAAVFLQDTVGWAEPLGGLPLKDWTYDRLYAAGWTANRLLNSEVRGVDAGRIGIAQDLLMDSHGQITTLVIRLDGNGSGEGKQVQFPWEKVSIGEYDEIRVPVAKERIPDWRPLTEDQFGSASKSPLSQTWKASDLINDHAVLKDGSGLGYVSNMVFDKTGKLQAVIVRHNPEHGPRGEYAYPWVGLQPYWSSGLDRYVLPYDAGEISDRELFDYRRLNPESLKTMVAPNSG